MTDLNYITNLTNRLISIQSNSKNYSQVGEVISMAKKELEKAKLRPVIFRENRVTSLFVSLNGNKKPKLLLNGHVDVVPGKDTQYVPTIIGDQLIGRGSYDMKAACAVFIALMRELNKQNKKSDVGLLLVGDEEIGGRNGTKYLLSKGYGGQFVITGEPSNFDIRLESKGVLWVEVIIKGKSAHGARVWDGKNALLQAFDRIQKLLKIYPIPSKEVWKTTVNVGALETENTLNIVPSICKIGLDIRFIPKENPEDILNNIKKCFPLCDITVIENEPPMTNDKNNIFIKEFFNVVKKQEKTIKYYNGHGSSDARFYTNKGIPAISFGPIGADLHGDNEWVSIQSLDKYYQVLFNFIKENC